MQEVFVFASTIQSFIYFSFQLQMRISAEAASEAAVDISQFRGNLIVQGGRSFDEDVWDDVVIGDVAFMCISPCTRCQMICVNQHTGARSNEPLRTLATFRRIQVCRAYLSLLCCDAMVIQGKVLFGMHLQHKIVHESPVNRVKIGDLVTVVSRRSVPE